jgi:hypothetical protein
MMSVLLGIIFVGGCSQALGPNEVLPGSTATFSQSDEDVFQAAEKVIAEDYRIDSIDREREIIQAVPMEYRSKESVASISDVLVQSHHTFRRVVTLQVRPAEENLVAVSVRADVQRLDTAPMAAFASQRQGDDRPSAQSMNEDVGDNRARSEVWTSIKRDYAAEQDVLGKIGAILGKSSVTTKPTTTACSK